MNNTLLEGSLCNTLLGVLLTSATLMSNRLLEGSLLTAVALMSNTLLEGVVVHSRSSKE